MRSRAAAFARDPRRAGDARGQAGVLGQDSARHRLAIGLLCRRGCGVLAAGALVAAVYQGLEGGNQMVLAITNQINAAHGLERFA